MNPLIPVAGSAALLAALMGRSRPGISAEGFMNFEKKGSLARPRRTRPAFGRLAAEEFGEFEFKSRHQLTNLVSGLPQFEQRSISLALKIPVNDKIDYPQAVNLFEATASLNAYYPPGIIDRKGRKPYFQPWETLDSRLSQQLGVMVHPKDFIPSNLPINSNELFSSQDLDLLESIQRLAKEVIARTLEIYFTPLNTRDPEQIRPNDILVLEFAKRLQSSNLIRPKDAIKGYIHPSNLRKIFDMVLFNHPSSGVVTGSTVFEIDFPKDGLYVLRSIIGSTNIDHLLKRRKYVQPLRSLRLMSLLSRLSIYKRGLSTATAMGLYTSIKTPAKDWFLIGDSSDTAIVSEDYFEEYILKPIGRTGPSNESRFLKFYLYVQSKYNLPLIACSPGLRNDLLNPKSRNSIYQKPEKMNTEQMFNRLLSLKV